MEHFIHIPDNNEALYTAVEDLKMIVDLCGFIYALARKEEVSIDELLLNLQRG